MWKNKFFLLFALWPLADLCLMYSYKVVPLMKRDQLDSLRKGSDAVAEIVFPVQLPPLGIAVYFVKKDQGSTIKIVAYHVLMLFKLQSNAFMFLTKYIMSWFVINYFEFLFLTPTVNFS